MKNILRLIERSSNLYPNKIFLRDINKEFNLTYKKTLDFIYKLNDYFFNNKIKKEKIIVIFDNSILLSLLFLGITSTNRVFVPVNPEIGKYEFLNILKTSGAKILIIDEIYKKKFSKLFKKKSICIKNHLEFVDDICTRKKKNLIKISLAYVKFFTPLDQRVILRGLCLHINLF